jgi:hypothetical protein
MVPRSLDPSAVAIACSSFQGYSDADKVLLNAPEKYPGIFDEP